MKVGLSALDARDMGLIFLDPEDPLEGVAMHSSFLVCRIPWTGESGYDQGVAEHWT